MQDPSVFGIPVDFILFGLTLAGVAVFHKCTMRVALTGLVTIIIYKIAFTGFKTGDGVTGFISHVGHEWVILVNLLCLLMGFALLSQHFEKSQLPLALPKFLPHDWKGGFVLLVMVWVLSSFLDNIAAALIGGAMAHQLFRGKVHIGYLAAIVAASNAGGSWSVLGDTTTTMMWIAGVAPSQVFEAITAATVALLVFGIPAAIKQHRHSHNALVHHCEQVLAVGTVPNQVYGNSRNRGEPGAREGSATFLRIGKPKDRRCWWQVHVHSAVLLDRSQNQLEEGATLGRGTPHAEAIAATRFQDTVHLGDCGIGIGEVEQAEGAGHDVKGCLRMGKIFSVADDE